MLCPSPWFPGKHEESEQECCEMMTDLCYRQPCVIDQCLMQTWNITHVSCDITIVYQSHLHFWHLDAFVKSDLE